MSEGKSEDVSLVSALSERGLTAQLTHEASMDAWLNEQPRTFYIGYDPTADSLHAGHLVPMMAARWLASAGHRCILLVGGGTARVGDPTGKTEARPVLDDAVIAHHAEQLHKQMKRLLPATAEVQIVNNASWLNDVTLLGFLRDIAKHFSVARMLSAETYKARISSGLSLLELLYQPLQSLDFSVLCEQHDCRLQLGGDDQWSNILGGIELCRRRGQGQTYGWTMPLITTASGAKMGKTQQGALWLDAGKTSPAEFYQYWVNVPDADLSRFLRLLTTLPLSDIAAIEHRPSVEWNAAKSILAFEVTAWVHGEDAARAAHLSAMASFGGRVLPEALLPSSRVPRAIEASAADMPTHEIAASERLELAALLVALRWAKSNNEARRLIVQGAVVWDQQKVMDAQFGLEPGAIPTQGVVLRAGKKRVVRIVVGKA